MAIGNPFRPDRSSPWPMTSPLLTPPWNLGDNDPAALWAAMRHSRALTLELFADISDAQFTAQGHADFSPVGWHLGHIGYTESLWILEKLAGQPGVDPTTRRLYAADGLPKADRQNLPDRHQILAQLADIRSQVETVLAQTDLTQHPRLGPFLLQHESQHCETVAIVLAALGDYPNFTTIANQPAAPSTMIHIPAGGFWQGDRNHATFDNEQPRHWVELPAYAIAATPVTCAQYQEFIQAGGYAQPQWWSAAGWAWLRSSPAPLTQPQYWQANLAASSHPVCGVSWYEADAYARFRGHRLPTEAEWERAARWDGSVSQTWPWGDRWPHQPTANLSGLGRSLRPGTTPVQQFPSGRSPAGLWDCIGNVWEWTDSWFEGYPGFEPWPYRGYSEVYFDRAHRVLRGGSWATRPWSIRASFRNWYYPETRVIFAGFRTCRDA
jgi:gamma-glutamyl hercynylcysteine S-oxide synthase